MQRETERHDQIFNKEKMRTDFIKRRPKIETALTLHFEAEKDGTTYILFLFCGAAFLRQLRLPVKEKVWQMLT